MDNMKMPTYDIENKAYLPDENSSSDRITRISVSDIDNTPPKVPERRRSALTQNNGSAPAISISANNTISSLSPDENESPSPGFGAIIRIFLADIHDCYESNRDRIITFVYIIMALFWSAYLVAALILNFKKAIPLLVISVIGVLSFLYYMLYLPYASKRIDKKLLQPVKKQLGRIWSQRWIRIGTGVCAAVAIIILLIVDTWQKPTRLVPIVGLGVYVLLLFVFSKHPGQVNWRPVVWGLGLQVIFGLAVLRWPLGRKLFVWVAQKITAFLGFVDAGASFVYGFTAAPPEQLQHDYRIGPTFAFAILPVVFFFSSLVSVLYYWGAIQWLVVRVGWLMQRSLDTTAAESLSCASNIFLSMTEAPLLIKPFFDKMSKSELHAVMTGGFATIAGSVFATYVRFGACASHILSASVMSAPAALATSKLFYPETEESQTKEIKNLELPKGQESNVLEAASNGATQAIDLILNIIANLIVYVSLLAFLNYMIAWFGMLIDVPGLSFEKIISYLFFPFAFLMGATDASDSDVMLDQTFKVSQLMGIKTFLNEFVAYERLGQMIYCCQISPRSELIATYSLCGFSNPGAIGIQIGCLSAMCPSKKSTLSQVAVRAMIAGSIACFMTACVAGVLVTETPECATTGRANSFEGLNCTAKFGETRNTSCSRYSNLYGG